MNERSIEKNVNTLSSCSTCSTTNISKVSSETDTNYKSNTEHFLCKFIHTEDDISPSSVPEETTGRVFIGSKVSKVDEEKQELMEEELFPVYAMDRVPIFDEFALNLDVDDDYE